MGRELGALFASAWLFATAGLSYADVLVGVAGPFSGPDGWIGEQTQRGVTMAVADLNNKGGILGQRIKLIELDDLCSAEQAEAVAKKFVSEGVILVAGHPCSGVAIPASKIYGEAGILMISDGATNPKLTDQGLSNVFRLVGRDDEQGRIAGEYLAANWSKKKIAILHDGETYGKGLAEQTKHTLNQLGVKEVLFESITPGKKSYADEIEKLRSLAADLVYYGGYTAEAALIVREAKDHNLNLQFVAGDGIGSEDFWLISGPAGEGTLLTFYPDARARPSAKEVAEKFRKDGYEPMGTTLYAYAVIQVWAQAVEQAQSLELGKVAEVMHAREFSTVLGPIRFDQKGDVKGVEAFVWYVWRDGKYIPLDLAVR